MSLRAEPEPHPPELDIEHLGQSHRDPSRRWTAARWWLPLAGLCGLGLAQPLLDLLGRSPQFFVARSVSGSAIPLLVVIALLIPPTLLILPPLLVRHPPSRKALVGVALAVPGTAIGLLLLRSLPLPAMAVAIGGLLTGCGIAAAWLTSRRIRELLDFVGVLTLVAVPATFLLGPAGQLWLGGSTSDDPTTPAPEAMRAWEGDPPLVLLVLDELPLSSLLRTDGSIDAELFPSFARLEATSTWYRNASSVATLTLTAVPALLTGKYPQEEQLATHADHPQNLLALLPDTIPSAIHEPRTDLCPPRRCTDRSVDGPFSAVAAVGPDLGWLVLHLTLPRPWTRSLPSPVATWNLSAAGDRTADFRHYLASLEPTDRFVFAHLELPHHPWIHLPSGARYSVGGEAFAAGLEVEKGNPSKRWVDDPWPVLQAWQRHLMQSVHADRLLGEAMTRLETLGLWDEALVVVTADHGIAFRPAGEFRTLDGVSDPDIIGVPLFVKLPEQTTGTVDDRVAELVDVVPTFLAAVGATPPGDLDGHDLLAPPIEGRRRYVFHTREEQGWIDDADLSGRLATVDRKSGFFGESGGPERLFRVGPASDELLGRELSAFRREPPTEAEVRLEDLFRLQDIEPGSTSLPARPVGTLLGPEGNGLAGVPLALSLDGVVQATTWTRRDAGLEGRFSFMLPKTTLTPGAHRVELWRIEGAPGAPVLRALRKSGPQAGWQLEGRRTLQRPNGERIELEPGVVDGSAAGIVYRHRGFRVEIAGYASSADGTAAREVLIFGDGRLLGSTKSEPPASAAQSPRERPPGSFSIFLSRGEVLGSAIRVVAVAGDGRVSELPFHMEETVRERSFF